MTTIEMLELMPALYVASAFMGLVFRWEVQMFRWIKKLFAF